MMTWLDIARRAHELHERYESGGSLAWYRGQRRAEWPLLSSGHRHIQDLLDGVPHFEDEADRINLLREELKGTFRRFQSDAWSLLSETERSSWGVLFTMQHFGLPTRLMDWTESFACAVFFAQLERSPENDAAIWVLDSHALNQTAMGRHGIFSVGDEDGEEAFDTTRWNPKWPPGDARLPTIAVHPVFATPRMVAQRSMFTLSGDSFQPLEHQFEDLVRDERLVKIVLPKELFAEADQYLAEAGLTAFNFYPDLQGLAMKHQTHAQATKRNARRYFPDAFK